jgi:lysophospholipid acyltransferase (LPLAT)-like uncharacterized protein
VRLKVPAGPAAVVTGLAARGLALSWSWRVRDGRATAGPEGSATWREVRAPLELEPAVYVAWHEHLLPLALLHRQQGVMALVSRHRDGEILARVLRGLGYGVARGSSTRGGGAGLQRMVRAGRAGTPLAFTPDGPRGPARTCKPGAVRAAAETGLPVVPLAAAAGAARRLGSWDRFLVPAPASRIWVARGDALEVPSEAADEVGEWAARVGRALEAERRRAERAAGGEGP